MKHADFALNSGFAARLFVPPPIPAITTTTVPNGQVGSSYTATLQATGGTTGYTWSLASGTLPAGLTLVQGAGIATNIGVIQGTPTAAGSSSFTALVTDALAQTDVQAISLTIGNAPPPPQPVVSTSSLPAATVGTAYSATLQATSGTLPYTWSVLSGALPSGLSLSQGSGGNLNRGVISGTPTAAGTSTVGFQVSDGLAQHATKTLSLTVNPKTFTPLPQTIPFGSAPSTTNLQTETLQPGAQSPPYPINWNAQGQFVTTPFNCPAGLTQFTIRYAAAQAAGGSRQISLDGTVIFANLNFPSTGAWSTWSTVSFNRTLTAGDHTMTMLFDVPSGSHDFINPDNLKLTVGSASGSFTIPPTLEWSSSNTGDQTAALQAFLNSVPSGTTSTRNTIQAVFGQRYRIEGTVYLGSAVNPTITPKHDLNFDFNGAEFFCTVPNPYGIEAASSIANNWFTYVAHGLDGTAPMQVSGGLSNTKGISTGGTYWPIIINADRFRLSASQGGAVITLTGGNDTQVNFRNAAPPNPRAFLFSSNFPGNDNFDRIMFSAEGCQNIRFTDSASGGQITGAQTNGTMGTYDSRYEAQAGITVLGGTNIEIDSLDIRSTLGDGVAVLGSTTYGQPTFVNIHDNTIAGSGRHGISLGNGGATDCTIAYNSIIGAPRHLIDFEDDNAGTTAPLRRNTIKGNYFRCGNNPDPANLNAWLAMAGESLNMGDIVVGGLLGHPEDGNLVVGVMKDDVRNATTAKSTTRRGPYTFGYNVGGGQIQLTTHQGLTTATYTGLVNNTRFTDTQVLQLQPIAGTTLPHPCQITAVNEATRTVTLSHPASSGGTQTITATFGGQADPQGFDFEHIDGANCFFNTIVVQPGVSDVGSQYDACTGINDHDNIVFGGSDSRIVNPITSSGGKTAVRLAMGQQQPQFNFIASVTSHWDAAGTVSWNRNWNYNTCVETDSFRACATDSTGFGVPGRPVNVFRVAAPVASFLNGSQDSKMASDAANLQLAYQRQGNVPQLVRMMYEFDGGWMPWSIGGQTQSGSPNTPTTSQINQFCQAIQRIVTRMTLVSPTLKFDLCGSLGYGTPSNIFGHGHTVWDAVMSQLGGKFHGGIIDYFDWDAYSNGPPAAPWLQDELDMCAAQAVTWGVQVAHGEFGIGGTISPVISQPPHNYTPSTWGTTFVNWWKSLPASGPGSMGHVEIFDIGGDGVFLDGRGGVLVPNGEGPAFAGAIETGLL